MYTYTLRYIQKFTSVTFKYLSLFQSSFCNKSDFPMHIINELNPVITSVTCRALRTGKTCLASKLPKKNQLSRLNELHEPRVVSITGEMQGGEIAASRTEKKLLTKKKKIKIRATRRKTNILCLNSVVGFLPGRPPALVLSQASCMWQEHYRWSSNITHRALSA